MASQTEITAKLKLHSEGIKEATADSEKLNKSLERGRGIASNPKKATMAPTTAENVEYGQARAAVGTGAAGRDFAKQAQGLGGLVHLYATWAANVYAVGAAFRALSDAADTTNMIKGMDQLGVSSGVALGSLAKKFMDATGGAISFQDAISATTKAMSAGLSTKQFEQIGEVATKASRALGIGMSDAVSRLTRGIVKVEPELLDELGLFTKVGQASEEYARRIGKTVSSLSDFEKRQAFTNAVLKEGRDKFADINVEANPYDRLAASVKDLTQNGLELINKVLGPIINLLSTSPVALSGVMAGLGLMLVKQAIPAIGQYRQSLIQSADEATAKWQKKSDDLKKIERDQFQYILNLSEQQADSRLAAFEKAEARISKSRAKSVLDARAQEILAKGSYTEISKQDIKYLRDTAKIQESSGNTELAKEYREAANALRQWIAAEKEHKSLLEQVNAQTDKNISSASKLSAQGYARDQLSAAQKGKAKSGIIAGVAEDVSMGTFGEAWAKMNKSIASEKLTGLDKVFTKTGGAAVIATTGVTRVIGALSRFIGWVGIATSALTTLYGWVSTNRQEEEKLAKAIDYASEVTKTSIGTFDKFQYVISEQSILAKSTAMAALGDSVSDTVTKFIGFDEASGPIDNAWESFKRLFELSKQDIIATSLSQQLMLQLDNLDDPELKKAAETKLANLFNIKSVNFKSLQEGISKIDPSELSRVPVIMEEVNTKSQATALAISAVRDSFKQVNTEFTSLSNTLIQQDPLSKYASALANNAKNMAEAFKNPQVAAAQFGEILKDNSRLAAFPPEAASQISVAAQEYKKLSDEIDTAKQQLDAVNKELAKGAGALTGYFSGRKLELELKLKTDKNSLVGLGTNLRDAAAKSMEYAFNIASKKFNSALQQAAIDQQKTLVGFLPKSEGTIKLQTDLEIASIKIREREITAIYNLTQEYKKASAAEAVKTAQAEVTKAEKLGPAEQQKAAQELKTAESNLKALNDPNLAKNQNKYEKTAENFKQMSEQSGYSAQLATLVSQEQNLKLKQKVDTYILSLDNETKTAQDRVALKTKAFEELQQTDDYRAKSLEEQKALKDKFIAETQADRLRVSTSQQLKDYSITGYVAQLAGPDSEIGKVAETDLVKRKSELDTATKLFNIEEKRTSEADKYALLQTTVQRDFSRQDAVSQQLLDSARLKNDTELKSIDSAQQMLDLENSLSMLSVKDYTDKSNALKARKIEIDRVQQLLDLEEERRKKLAAINEEIAKAGGRDKVEPTRLAQLDADTVAIQNRYKEQKAGVDLVTKALRDQQALDTSLSLRQKAYADVFKASFDSMADAMVDWAKTGKWAGKDLFNSLIGELLRYELKLQTTSLYGSLRTAIVGGGGSTANPTGATGAEMDLFSMQYNAKGAAYEIHGVEAFAQGGAFTNSIVDSPTMFKFAKGTGLMGEAGPEAIMPLKRDANGNLGVRGGNSGGNTEVVVNNYSNQPAQAQETIDSRGNRRIEVVVGELSAADINRTGSTSQQAMAGTYGIKPRVIRR